MKFRYGIMQGRLSPLVGNKIQAFPKNHWQKEFFEIKKNGLKIIEWTLDYRNLNKNPLITTSGKKKIKYLSKKNIKNKFGNLRLFYAKTFLEN